MGRHPDKRKDIIYGVGMARLWRRIGSGGDFYQELFRPENRALRREYFSRNPVRYEEYQRGRRYYAAIRKAWEYASRAPDFGKAWGAYLSARPWLREEYLRRNPSSRVGGVGVVQSSSRYYDAITSLYRKAKRSGQFGSTWFEGLRSNDWLRREYFSRNPDKKAAYHASVIYSRHMSHWVALLRDGRYDQAREYFDSMPSWVQERYQTNNPRSDGSGGSRFSTFRNSSAYYGAMSRWGEFLEKGDYEGANKFFNSLPSSIREQYFARNPENRAKIELSTQQLVTMSQYWLMPEDDPSRLEWGRNNPELMAWIRDHADTDSLRRAAIMQAYRYLPKEEAWMRRAFAARYPEIFSQEAIGQQKLDRVAQRLADNPELVPFYEKMVRYLSEAYIDQNKYSGAPPKPITFERLNRWHVKRRRRFIAMSQKNRRHLRIST